MVTDIDQTPPMKDMMTQEQQIEHVVKKKHTVFEERNRKWEQYTAYLERSDGGTLRRTEGERGTNGKGGEGSHGKYRKTTQR